MVRSPLLAPVHLLGLLQELNQRGKSQHRKSRPPLQRPEETRKALLGDDLTGELYVGPDRLSGPGCQLSVIGIAPETCVPRSRAARRGGAQTMSRVLRVSPEGIKRQKSQSPRRSRAARQPC